jgi:DinB superfamily
MKTTVATIALLMFVPCIVPQATSAQINNPVSNALRDTLPGRQANTVAAVEAMPADKFSFKPSAGQRTFGQLVVHMMMTNYFLCSKTAAISAPVANEIGDTDAKDKLVTALKDSFAFCSETLKKMDDTKLSATTEGFDGKQVTRAWFALTLAGTWADHYAETAMYLRLNGMTPPTVKI